MIRREAHLTSRGKTANREIRSYETIAALAIGECILAIDKLIEKAKGDSS